MSAIVPPAVPRAVANVLGVRIDTLPAKGVVRRLLRAAANGESGYVCVTGVHGVMEAQRDDGFRDILNASLLTVPDGMPTVWMGKLQGHADMTRVYGPSLMLDVCEASVAEGRTHFLFGGLPGVAEELATRLRARFPGLKIVGTYTPPFRPLAPAEEQELLSAVAALQPDFFWVGLSTPKQERFMASYGGRLSTRVLLGVGAAFDMHSGRTRQAPRWVQRAGLEWLFRLLQEPRRLFARYAKNNPAFVWRAIGQLAGLRSYPLVARVEGGSRG